MRNWQIRILASDISNKILTRGRSGYYSSLEINRGLPVALRDRYFHRQGRGWLIDDEICQMVEFFSNEFNSPLDELAPTRYYLFKKRKASLLLCRYCFLENKP